MTDTVDNRCIETIGTDNSIRSFALQVIARKNQRTTLKVTSVTQLVGVFYLK